MIFESRLFFFLSCYSTSIDTGVCIQFDATTFTAIATFLQLIPYQHAPFASGSTP